MTRKPEPKSPHDLERPKTAEKQSEEWIDPEKTVEKIIKEVPKSKPPRFKSIADKSIAVPYEINGVTEMFYVNVSIFYGGGKDWWLIQFYLNVIDLESNTEKYLEHKQEIGADDFDILVQVFNSIGFDAAREFVIQALQNWGIIKN